MRRPPRNPSSALATTGAKEMDARHDQFSRARRAAPASAGAVNRPLLLSLAGLNHYFPALPTATRCDSPAIVQAPSRRIHPAAGRKIPSIQNRLPKGAARCR